MPNMAKGELFIVTMYLSSYLIIQVFFVLCFCYFFILHINGLRGMLATFFLLKELVQQVTPSSWLWVQTMQPTSPLDNTLY
jgi:hypothetical protein